MGSSRGSGGGSGGGQALDPYRHTYNPMVATASNTRKRSEFPDPHRSDHQQRRLLPPQLNQRARCRCATERRRLAAVLQKFPDAATGVVNQASRNNVAWAITTILLSSIA